MAMNSELYKNYILAMIIAIPAIIGLVNIKKIDNNYWPIILICLLAVINENISLYNTIHKKINFTTNNFYFLINSCLLLVLFNMWGVFNKYKNIFYFLLGLFASIWLTDNFIISKLNEYTFYNRLYFSLVIVVLATIVINRLIFEAKGSLLTNARFLICTAIIIFYTMRILSISFSILKVSLPMQIAISNISKYSATIYNLLFLIAVICLPRKKTSLLPY
jgi:hypothetical protein